MVLAAAAAVTPGSARNFYRIARSPSSCRSRRRPDRVLARVLGERMRAALGQPVLVENVTGAGGSIGVGRVVASAPDGYTIGIGHFGTHVANGAVYPLKYDSSKDLDPVGPAAEQPDDRRDAAELPGDEPQGARRADQGQPRRDRCRNGRRRIGLAYRQPPAPEPHQRTDIIVPYRGTGPAFQDLVAGQIDLIVDQAANCAAAGPPGDRQGFSL